MDGARLARRRAATREAVLRSIEESRECACSSIAAQLGSLARRGHSGRMVLGLSQSFGRDVRSGGLDPGGAGSHRPGRASVACDGGALDHAALHLQVNDERSRKEDFYERRVSCAPHRSSALRSVAWHGDRDGSGQVRSQGLVPAPAIRKNLGHRGGRDGAEPVGRWLSSLLRRRGRSLETAGTTRLERSCLAHDLALGTSMGAQPAGERAGFHSASPLSRLWCERRLAPDGRSDAQPARLA